MRLPNTDDVKTVDGIVSKKHGFVLDSCPAVVNGVKGFLGVSRLAWFRVWFDETGGESRTLLTCATKKKALAKFNELKMQYGV